MGAALQSKAEEKIALQDGLDEFQDLLVDEESSVDWEDVHKKEQEVELMLHNARYRLRPEGFGMRSNPLATPGTPAAQAYENKLVPLENR